MEGVISPGYKSTLRAILLLLQAALLFWLSSARAEPECRAAQTAVADEGVLTHETGPITLPVNDKSYLSHNTR